MNDEKKDGGTSLTAGDGVSVSVPTTQLPHAAPAFTPGPWTRGAELFYCIKAGDDCVVCMGHDYNDHGCIQARYKVTGEKRQDGARYDAEAQANAHLIASAPDLYHALKAWIEYETVPYCDLPPDRRDVEILTLIDKAKAALAKAEGRAV